MNELKTKEMNENQAMQEKDFNRLIENFNRFAELRDKQISEIETILDRMKPQPEPIKQNDAPKSGTSVLMDGIIYNLNAKVTDIDKANERLGVIIRRLNELF